ncbi:MAG: 4Fe-4S dicluster domain-containing protein, partial [Firmicutes bacterium]|nr:4Fe-4S dicluster domain-containing protein [Bacillota bacterium]
YEMLRGVKEIFDRMALVPCTKCRYCMPCPFGLNIPGLFEAYNQTASVSTGFAKRTYATHEVKADACRACHRCEKECPQHIQISEIMKKVAETLGE